MKRMAGEVIGNLPKALISWYAFASDTEALFISGGDAACEVLCEVLQDSGVKVVQAVLGELESADAERKGKQTVCGKKNMIILWRLAFLRGLKILWNCLCA